MTLTSPKSIVITIGWHPHIGRLNLLWRYNCSKKTYNRTSTRPSRCQYREENVSFFIYTYRRKNKSSPHSVNGRRDSLLRETLLRHNKRPLSPRLRKLVRSLYFLRPDRPYFDQPHFFFRVRGSRRVGRVRRALGLHFVQANQPTGTSKIRLGF